METVWSVWWKMKSWNSSVIILCHEPMCVLQDNNKLNEKFIRVKENGKSCDANISSQQTAQNVITGALKTEQAETSKVRSRLSDKAVQRSNPRPGTIIPSHNLEHCLGLSSSAAGALHPISPSVPTKINLMWHWVSWGSLCSHPLAALGLMQMDAIKVQRVLQQGLKG